VPLRRMYNTLVVGVAIRRFFLCLRDKLKSNVPYVNIEANGSYPDGAYTSGNVEVQVGYEGATTNGINWYASVGPTVQHTETADEFGDVEIAGYLGGSKGINENVGVYGEIYGATNNDDLDVSGKVGLKYTF